MTDYDIRWVNSSLGRYIKATETGSDWDGWTLDPDEGDSPAELRRNAELFNAVADWLEAQERKADPDWVAAEHAAGKAHATKKRSDYSRLPFPTNKLTVGVLTPDQLNAAIARGIGFHAASL